ncbi:MAG: hypothetical protein MHPDNHAH_01003 [Anaerolineales bacterium]|nr:hypothetical protein [Anaerolineales bacterium]WKZ46391.1 MAG: hypothetical protein QY306_11305 [Anaerolineales bacterium]
MNYTWKLKLGSPHTIRLTHAMSGEVVTTVDNKEALRKILPRGEDLEHQFKIENKPCSLRILYKLERFGGMATMETWDHELLVDGVRQPSESS